MQAARVATDGRAAGTDRVPTLTEVVELAPDSVLQATAPRAPDAAQLVALVLAELAPRIDALLEARLRDALAPALARAADTLIRDTRDGLAQTLHALVNEAVGRVLGRQDGG